MAKSKSYGGLVFLLIVVAAAAGGTWYYFNGRGEKQPEFTTQKIARGNITQAVTATGDLQPVAIVDIGAQVSGLITEVRVDFNSVVKKGDILAKIDPSTPQQRFRQAQADLESTKASNELARLNLKRKQELKHLVTQEELDNALAQVSQSNAQLLTREAALANAQLDLDRTTIYAPMDGVVLDRKTDVGRTVNSSTNAPVLFTIVNDLSKMQINAAVAEADIGLISEGQPVRFTVDAFPGSNFIGSVRQVRNAATANQSVVSYATIIEVNNADLKLKPGMTANVSIIVSERNDVVRVPNTALRVRIDPKLQEKVLPAAGAPAGDARANGAPAAKMMDSEVVQSQQAILREVGFQRGTPATPEQIEKAKVMAKEKGLDPELVAAQMAMPAGRRGGRGGGFGRGGGGGGGAGDRGFNNSVVTRPVYVIPNPDAVDKQIQTVNATLGISDGIYTEVLGGLKEGDAVLTAITMPGAAPILTAPQGGQQNPFGGGGRGGFPGGGGGGGGMRGGGGR